MSVYEDFIILVRRCCAYVFIVLFYLHVEPVTAVGMLRQLFARNLNKTVIKLLTEDNSYSLSTIEKKCKKCYDKLNIRLRIRKLTTCGLE